MKPMLADSLFRFAPDTPLEDFSRVPLLIAHGERNFLTRRPRQKTSTTSIPARSRLLVVERRSHRIDGR